MLGFCNESLRGNRICDEINNNHDCEYDWGDCCRPVVQCPPIKTEFNETFFVNETFCSNVTGAKYWLNSCAFLRICINYLFAKNDLYFSHRHSGGVGNQNPLRITIYRNK